MSNLAAPLIHLTRSTLVECVHRGHIAVVNSKGSVLQAAGDPHYVTFARSTAKLLQAVTVIEAGVANQYGLSEREIALLCASHSGELIHVETVQSILGKIGLDDSYLQCGAHAPFHKPSASALRTSGLRAQAVHNNCSGKHSGMLSLAVHLGASLEDYKQLKHPVQQAMLQLFSTFSQQPKEDIIIGIDGCGVPVYGVPLSALAMAYARFGTPPSGSPSTEPCRTVLRSIQSYPEMLAGTERYDTALIRHTGGRVIGKMGAEGVFAVSLPGQDLGLAIKIEDGSMRALYPVVTEALLQLEWIQPSEAEALAPYHSAVIRNWGGDEVGRSIPVFKLAPL